MPQSPPPYSEKSHKAEQKARIVYGLFAFEYGRNSDRSVRVLIRSLCTAGKGQKNTANHSCDARCCLRLPKLPPGAFLFPAALLRLVSLRRVGGGLAALLWRKGGGEAVDVDVTVDLGVIGVSVHDGA